MTPNRGDTFRHHDTDSWVRIAFVHSIGWEHSIKRALLHYVILITLMQWNSTNISESVNLSHGDCPYAVTTVNPDPASVVGVHFLLPASKSSPKMMSASVKLLKCVIFWCWLPHIVCCCFFFLITVICLHKPCISKPFKWAFVFDVWSRVLCVFQTKRDRIQNHPFSSIARVKSDFRKSFSFWFFSRSFILLWTSSSLKHTRGIFNLFTFSVCWVLFVIYIFNVYPSASIQLLKMCLKFEHVQTCSRLSVPGSRLGPSGFFGGAGHLRFHRRCTF